MQNQNTSSLNITSWTAAELVSTGLMSLFFLVGVPGNIAVFLYVLQYFKKNNFSVRLMLNLAASDILCLITLPMWIYSEFHNIDQLSCTFFATLVYWSMHSSVITVTMLSVHRYIRIRHPQTWSRIGRRGETALLIISWTLALVFACPGVSTQEVIQRGPKNYCERNLNSKARLNIALLESVLGFFLPFTIMLTSYCCLYKNATRGVFNHHRQRLTKLVTRIIVVFLCFWAPHHIIKLVEITQLFRKSPKPDSLYKRSDILDFACDIAGILTFINSCVHPLLYAFSSKSLRQHKQPSTQET